MKSFWRIWCIPIPFPTPGALSSQNRKSNSGKVQGLLQPLNCIKFNGCPALTPFRNVMFLKLRWKRWFQPKRSASAILSFLQHSGGGDCSQKLKVAGVLIFSWTQIHTSSPTKVNFMNEENRALVNSRIDKMTDQTCDVLENCWKGKNNSCMSFSTNTCPQVLNQEQ